MQNRVLTRFPETPQAKAWLGRMRKMKLVAFQRSSRPAAGRATSSTHLYRIRRMKARKVNKNLAYHWRGTKNSGWGMQRARRDLNP